jgi:hypothetical protein
VIGTSTAPRGVTSRVWFAVCGAMLVATSAVGGAPRVVPLYDAVTILIEPMLRHGTDYVSWSASRLFFRPIEYYVNLGADRIGAPSLVLVFIVLVTAATATGLGRLAHPDEENGFSEWRWLTAALVFVHPLILASTYEYDRVSQALANMIGVLSLLCAARRPNAVVLLLALHVVGFAAKESYVSFFALSSGLAATQLWRSRAHSRLLALVLGCAIVAITYRWMHLTASNEALRAATPRYQLSLGTNVLRNTGLFLAGTAFLGSSARAAQGVSWLVGASVAASAGFWTAWLALVIRAAHRVAGGLSAFTRGLTPLFLGLAASLVPSILTQDVSENNASCFAGFAIAFAMALLRRSVIPVPAIDGTGRPPARVATVAVAVACLSCTTGSLDKLDRIRATSADSRFMAVQALRRAGRGRIEVECRYVPKRRYSIYNMPSSVLIDSIAVELTARGELAAGDAMSCAPPSRLSD